LFHFDNNGPLSNATNRHQDCAFSLNVDYIIIPQVFVSVAAHFISQRQTAKIRYELTWSTCSSCRLFYFCNHCSHLSCTDSFLLAWACKKLSTFAH